VDFYVRCVGVRATFEGWKILPRRIKDYEFVYVRSGFGEIMIDEKHISVCAGDFICFRPEIKHSLWLNQKPYMDFFLIHFSPMSDASKELIKQIPDHVHFKESRWLETFMKRICEADRQKGYLGNFRQEIILQQIICELLTRLHTEQNPMAVKRIGRVLGYIHENPCREYRLEELLGVADIKKTLFLQSFREVTGTTPIQYITDVRLDMACDLLLETDLGVAQIGEQCGFSDPFYFSRCFKKKYSVSPRQYRESKI